MSRSAAPPAPAGRARKSPLRLTPAAEPSFPLRQPNSRLRQPNSRLSREQLRTMMISEFEQWLRSRTNQEKRPFRRGISCAVGLLAISAGLAFGAPVARLAA